MIRDGDTIKEIGCIATLLVHRKGQGCDLHHPFGKKGENYHRVYGLSPYHHRGLLPEGMDPQVVSGFLGPSLEWGSRPFHAFFGSDELLLEIQAFLIREFEKSFWEGYCAPYEVRREALMLWNDNRS